MHGPPFLEEIGVSLGPAQDPFERGFVETRARPFRRRLYGAQGRIPVELADLREVEKPFRV